MKSFPAYAKRITRFPSRATFALSVGALALACVEQMSFRRETTADKAACRNIARDVTDDDAGEEFNEAYNDCMLSKGYKPRD